MSVQHCQQVQVLEGFLAACVRRPLGACLGPEQRAQPVGQLSLGLEPGDFSAARQGGLACSLDGLRGRGRNGIRTNSVVEQSKPLVGGLERQRDPMLALLADRTAAVAGPARQCAVGLDLNIHFQLVGVGVAALDLAHQQPVAVRGLDLQAQHPLLAVQHQATSPGAGFRQLLQRARVKPQAVSQHHRPSACSACKSAW